MVDGVDAASDAFVTDALGYLQNIDDSTAAETVSRPPVAPAGWR